MDEAAVRNKETKVRHIFDNIADEYDRANVRISLTMQERWKACLIRQIVSCTPPGSRVLDVCCGTGDIASAAARVREDLDVTGVDFSEAMLQVARRKHSLKNLHLLQGNALELPFEKDRFMASVISFGLRNTADYERVLQEMVRVTKKGGLICCLDSMVPENPAVLPFYRLYFTWFMPLLGGGRQHYQEYRWLHTSTESFLKKHELQNLFEKTGCSGIETKTWLFGSCVLVSGRKAG